MILRRMYLIVSLETVTIIIDTVMFYFSTKNILEQRNLLILDCQLTVSNAMVAAAGKVPFDT